MALFSVGPWLILIFQAIRKALILQQKHEDEFG